MERGGIGRMESMGIMLSMAGQEGGREGYEAWQAMWRDVVEFSERLVNLLSEPETHVAGQQQPQSQPATVSSLDMVRAPNRESSQGQAIVSGMLPPARGTQLPPEYLSPRVPYIDPRTYGMSPSSGGGYGNLYVTGDGAPWGTEPAQSQARMPRQPAMPRTSQNPHVWSAGLQNVGLQNVSLGPLFSDEFQEPMPGHGAGAGVGAGFQEQVGQAMGQGMGQAPPMGRVPSHFSTSGQALLGRGIGMAGGDAGGPGGQGQAGMPGGHGQQVWPQGGQEQDDEDFQRFYNLNSDLRGNEYGGGA